jgi:hypothetical protein
VHAATCAHQTCVALSFKTRADIKIRRLGWAGHIIRMEEERITEQIPNGQFYNRRTVGKTRTRWEDVIQTDALQVLGM